MSENLEKQNNNNVVECSKCHKQTNQSDGKLMDGQFVCDECLKKSNNKRTLSILLVLLLIIAVGVVFLLLPKKNTTKGFGGVENMNDSLNVEVESHSAKFDISTTVLTSAQVSEQEPVSNISDFRRFLSQSTTSAEEMGSTSLQIPVVSILFDFNSSDITSESEELIKEVAELYQKTNQKSTIVVSGYACNIGDDNVNNIVSQQRAINVKSIFEKLGVANNKIKTEWFGKTRNNEFNLPANSDYRRVLISIVDDK